MAQSLQLLKRRIKTANNISQVARSMEMISASKIKRAQKTVENNKPYAARIVELTGNILRHMDREKFNNVYVDGNDSDKRLLIVISTDKGLCGSLNTNLFRKLLEQDLKKTKILAIGKKSHQISNKFADEFVTGLPMGTSTPQYSMVFQLIEIINEEYLSGKVGKVDILYNQFNSVFQQVPTLQPLLPIATNYEEGTLPYLFEPKAESIINDLLPYYIETSIYSALIEAFTSEQAARMVAMQNAKNNATDIAAYLTLLYNKSRQERITNELLSLSNNN